MLTLLCVSMLEILEVFHLYLFWLIAVKTADGGQDKYLGYMVYFKN